MSATGFTTTDMDYNQLTGYYVGAMWKAAMLGLDDGPPDVEAVIIGPNDPGAMKRLVGECRDRGVRFVFDPAHQMPMMKAEDVMDSANGAWMVIGNDYELELIQQRCQRDIDGLLELAQIVVTTLGRHGSRITTLEGSVDIPAAPAVREANPTRAGDAYQSGLDAGLLRGLDPGAAAVDSSLHATHSVEHVGTIEHNYTRAEFSERYRESFGAALPDRFWVRD